MSEPTIEELEALLNGKEFNVVIMPNGEIKAACNNCLILESRVKELENCVCDLELDRDMKEADFNMRKQFYEKSKEKVDVEMDKPEA